MLQASALPSVPDHSLDPLGESVERLLVRFDEMKRTIALQNTHIERLRSERDLLESRLKLASERISGLIEHFPPVSPPNSP